MRVIRETIVRDTTGETANRTGRAGEHLVCAELLKAGYECFLAEGKAPYDIVADVDRRLVRIQVKTTSGVKFCPQRQSQTPVYAFGARRVGKLQRKGYEPGQADLIAYVALDSHLIAYLPAERVAQSAVFRIRAYEDDSYTKTGMFMDQFPLRDALDNLLIPETRQAPVQEGFDL